MRTLSAREREVLALVAEGRTNSEIAGELGISPLTVKKHLERMYSSVGAANRAELIARTLRDGSNGRATGPPRHNLPAPLTSFVGRERELAEVSALLERARLVTLGGPGGMGKTRLALEVARRMLERAPDGVWLVELASIAEPPHVVQAVAATLGLQERARSQLTALVDELRRKRALLVVDNCEHLARAVGEMVTPLLRGCSELRVLATSRETLGVAGEVFWSVPALALPESGRDVSAVMRSEAAQLFSARAALRAPTFGIDRTNAASVARLCARLDGMPLAIELAAARMNVLSVHEIADRLDDRFEELRTDVADVTPRHRTLRSAINWSFRLLGRTEARLFERLSVFAGGASLQAATKVCGDGAVPEEEVLELLARLVDRSFVIADTSRPLTRYRMFETTQSFARERLERSADRDAVRARHAAYFCAVAEEAEPHLKAGDQQLWARRLDEEAENVRAALRWSLDRDPVLALRLAGALWRFWFHRGASREGLRWLDEGLARAGAAVPDAIRAKALNAAGNLAHSLGDRERSESLHRKCLALRRAIGDRTGMVQSLSNLADRVRERGGFVEARALYDEAAAIATQLGDEWALALATLGPGHIALAQGDPERATRVYKEGLSHMRRSGDRLRTAHVLGNLGDAAMQQGRFGRAKAVYRRSLVTFREFGDRIGATDSVGFLGAVSAAEGSYERAARLLAVATAWRERRSDALWPPRDKVIADAWARVRAALEPARFATLCAAGAAMSFDEAIELALS